MRVAIISSNLVPSLARLQPYRTLLEMGRELLTRGHETIFISDGGPDFPAEDTVSGLEIRRVTSVQLFRGRQNPDFVEAVNTVAPDVILWHLGLGSFTHQQFSDVFSQPTIAVVTSPAHQFKEILHTTPRAIGSNIDLVATHLFGGLVPNRLIRSAFRQDALDGAIVLSNATRQYLMERGAPPDRTWVVPPGIDEDWLKVSLDDGDRKNLRRELGFSDDDFVVTYFGSPAPVRGIFTFIQAVQELATAYPQLKILVLSRRTKERWVREAARLDKVVSRDGDLIRVVDGYLDLHDLIRHVSVGDAVCLPFELLPSDVPLSILEAMAVGQAVITTRVACIPELVKDERGFLVEPGSVKSIANCLQKIVVDPKTTKVHQEHARAYVEAHRKWSDMGERLEQVLVSVHHG
jgi:glycosyltransferase involved in cell wall biosynthesis